MRTGSLESLYRYYMNHIYLYLLQLSGHPETAEDLVQETFIRAYEHLESYSGEQVRSWLFRVAHNAYIDWYRKSKRQVQMDPHIIATMNPGTEPSPEERYLIMERVDGWLEALQNLPEPSRQVILLRDYCDLTYQEIADILGLTVSKVKITLYRARQKVKEVIDSEL